MNSDGYIFVRPQRADRPAAESILYSEFSLPAIETGRARVHPYDHLAKVVTAGKNLKPFVGILEPIEDLRYDWRDPVPRDEIGCGLQVGLRPHGGP